MSPAQFSRHVIGFRTDFLHGSHDFFSRHGKLSRPVAEFERVMYINAPTIGSGFLLGIGHETISNFHFDEPRGRSG
jgi:hypothetical protein